MKLYEFPPTRSIRPRWMLQELEVPFESIRVDLPKGEHRSPAFLKLNPAAKVPVLVDGDLVLNESVAIVLYLADKHAEKGFLPRDPKSRAEMDRCAREGTPRPSSSRSGESPSTRRCCRKRGASRGT